MTRQILEDAFNIRFQLTESSDKGKLIARGQFAKADIPTANRRIYPGKLWKREINKILDSLKNRRVYGECDHPSDGKTKLQRVSHLLTNLQMEDDGTITGELEVIEGTKWGDTLAAIIRAGGEIGVSSRGLGSVKQNHEGYDVVQEDFSFMTFDCVADPAVSNSYPKFQYESSAPPPGEQIKEDKLPSSYKIFKNDDKFLLCVNHRYQGTYLNESDAKKAAQTLVESDSKTQEIYGKRAQTLSDMQKQADDLQTTKPEDSQKIKQNAQALGKDWGIDPTKIEEAEPEVPQDPQASQDQPEAPQPETPEAQEPVEKQPIKADVYILPDKQEISDVEKLLTRSGFDISDVQEKNQGVAFYYDPISETEKYEEAKLQIISMDLLPVVSPDMTYVTKKSGQKMAVNLDNAKIDDEQPQQAQTESLRQEAYAYAVEAVEPIIREKLILEFEEAYQAKASEIISENIELQEQVSTLGKVAKELGFNLFLERNLKPHPEFTQIRAKLGNYSRLESLQDLKDTVSFKLEEAKDFEKTSRLQHRQKVAMLETKIMKLEEKNKQLQEDTQKAIEQSKKLQEDVIHMSQSLSLTESKLFLEQSLIGHPRAHEIRSIVEATGNSFIEKSSLKKLVESYRPIIQTTEKSLFESVQAAMKRPPIQDNLVESSLANTRLGDATPTEGYENAHGLKGGEYEKLSGLQS